MAAREQNTIGRRRISSSGIVPGSWKSKRASTNAGTDKTLACVFTDMGADLGLMRFGLTDFPRHVFIIEKFCPGKK